MEIRKTKFEELQNRIAIGGSLSAQMQTGSMEPLIMAGANVEIEHIADYSALRTFDVLVIWSGERLLCHYLCHRNQLLKENGRDVFVTRGLRNAGEDIPVTSESILGKVNLKIPWYLKWREAFRRPRRRS